MVSSFPSGLMTCRTKKTTGMYAEPLNTTSTMSSTIPRASPAAMPTMRRLIVRSSKMVESVMVISLLILRHAGSRNFLRGSALLFPSHPGTGRCQCTGHHASQPSPLPNTSGKYSRTRRRSRSFQLAEFRAGEPYDECRRIIAAPEYADHRPVSRRDLVPEVKTGLLCGHRAGAGVLCCHYPVYR